MSRRKKRTQKQIADAIGVSPQQISRYKLGLSGLSTKTAIKLAKYLRVDFQQLMIAHPRDRPKLLGLKK